MREREDWKDGEDVEEARVRQTEIFQMIYRAASILVFEFRPKMTKLATPWTKKGYCMPCKGKDSSQFIVMGQENRVCWFINDIQNWCYNFLFSGFNLQRKPINPSHASYILSTSTPHHPQEALAVSIVSYIVESSISRRHGCPVT